MAVVKVIMFGRSFRFFISDSKLSACCHCSPVLAAEIVSHVNSCSLTITSIRKTCKDTKPFHAGLAQAFKSELKVTMVGCKESSANSLNRSTASVQKPNSSAEMREFCVTMSGSRLLVLRLAARATASSQQPPLAQAP